MTDLPTDDASRNSDDGVREKHGCALATPVHLIEREDVLGLVVNSQTGSRYDIKITPAQARYIARKLYHLARRIDKRVAQ